ncbi:hypothetical protein GCM10012275_30430 [Longimycelium tulufanense]|uniref:CU044_5270 family protein n=2 Tax=Longimycelium tulufanense TaxID=907463 RepID=A0A8J3FWY4_9PSEU|nr:hypothetical protein GCM10012275_30430 [Longimycelium tulufanense]
MGPEQADQVLRRHRLDPPEVDPPALHPPRTRRWRRPWIAAAAAMVTVLGVASVLAWSQRTTDVQVPPLLEYQPAAASDPQNLLRELADVAERQAVVGSGSVHYAKTRTWSFTTDATTRGDTIGTDIREGTVELWERPDGSGYRTTKGGQLPFDTADTVAPQTDPPAHSTGPVPPDLRDLPVRDAGSAVVDRLDARKPVGELLDDVADAWVKRSGDPTTAAAVLRFLADRHGLQVAGTTTDRAGRAAVAVSAEVTLGRGWFPHQRRYLLIDPTTGFPLALEHVALAADAQALGIRVATPVTVHYTLFERGGWVEQVRQPL